MGEGEGWVGFQFRKRICGKGRGLGASFERRIWGKGRGLGSSSGEGSWGEVKCWVKFSFKALWERKSVGFQFRESVYMYSMWEGEGWGFFLFSVLRSTFNI